MPLSDLVREVALARKAEQKAMWDLADATKVFEKEHADVICAADDAKIARGMAENNLRAAALEAPEEEVKATPGVKIRNVKTITYDEDKAFEMAKKVGVFLSLDKKAFEAAMKATKERLPEFVTVEMVPQATIARDLSEVLKDAES